MPITYTWNVNTMDAAPSEDGLINVVKVVHWRLSATDGAYHAETYSTVSLDSPDPSNFKPFNELTEAEVISWLESKLDVEQLKTSLVENIESQKAPKIMTLTGPWVSKKISANS